MHQWRPYAPDQAFGRQAARDEELLDAVVARLQKQHAQPPRAANRAPSGTNRNATAATWQPRADQLRWAMGKGAGLPVTTAIGLDAAARLRENQDG
jgi:hypothetical protein